MTTLTEFIIESNKIEGINLYKSIEVEAAYWFLGIEELNLHNLNHLQSAFAPGKPLRDQLGMDVQVGNYTPPKGGPKIVQHLKVILTAVQRLHHPRATPFYTHAKFEGLHPYIDGNGRTGRMLWAWHMKHQGEDPFLRPFLHTWYYQSLEHLAK